MVRSSKEPVTASLRIPECWEQQRRRKARTSVILGIGSLIATILAGSLAWASENADAPSGDEVGAKEYIQNCAACHGAGLSGGPFGPSLKSEAFRAKWDKVGSPALHEFVAQAMPPANPGGFPREMYARVVRYIEKVNNLTTTPAASVAAGSNSDAGRAAAAKTKRESQETAGSSGDLDNHDVAYSAEIARRRAVVLALPPISEEMLRNPPDQDWLAARRTDDGQAFSPLTEINRRNVQSLSLSYALALPTGTNGITPLVVAGVIFLNSNGTVLAIEAQSGEILWKFERPITSQVNVGPPVSQPRGLAVLNDRLFVPTSDNHVIALDIHTGKVVWDHVFEAHGLMRLAANPIVAKGKVIMGMSGCWDITEQTKCFIAGLDAKSGAEVWRFNTIPRPDEPNGDSWNGASYERRGGASIWSPGTYDPANNLIYFGTGTNYNIATLMTASAVPTHGSAGLYTDSTLALNPDTGKLVWFYQHMARDVWDLCGFRGDPGHYSEMIPAEIPR